MKAGVPKVLCRLSAAQPDQSNRDRRVAESFNQASPLLEGVGLKNVVFFRDLLWWVAVTPRSDGS